MNRLITLFFCLISSLISSQKIDLNSESSQLLKKGVEYYKILKVNELTLKHVNKETDFVFSYINDNQIISIVFSKNQKSDKILTSIIYSDSLTVTQKQDYARNASEKEKLFIKIYHNIYSSSQYFPLPNEFWVIIERKNNLFYAYMTPRQNNTEKIILGHDFLFKYKLNGKFKDFKFLHNNPILLPLNNPVDSNVSLHTHSNRNSDFISVLDIAVILISKDRLEWDKHFVISKKFVSIFDVKNTTLSIEFRKEYEQRTGKKLKI